MIKTEHTIWDQYRRETENILEELVDVHKKDSFKDLVINEITSEIIEGRGGKISSESNFWHEYLQNKINSFPDKYQSILWSFTTIFLWNLNTVSNEKFITNSPEIEEKIKDKIEIARVLLTRFYSKDIVDDTQENCVDLEVYGLDIYNNVYSVGVNSKTINWLGYYTLFFDNNNKKIRLINDLNLYGFYVDNMFIKPNTHRVLTLDLFEKTSLTLFFISSSETSTYRDIYVDNCSNPETNSTPSLSQLSLSQSNKEITSSKISNKSNVKTL